MIVDNEKVQSDRQKKLAEYETYIEEARRHSHFQEQIFRARSVTVGSAGGGICEISMRRPNCTVTYATLQPIEVVELIHQMSASIGCQIVLKPRDDFGSWRKWNKGDLNEMPRQEMPRPEKQPGLKFELNDEEQNVSKSKNKKDKKE